MSGLLDTPLTTLQGEPTTLRSLTGGGAALVVNVASRCGLTPQYTQLEALQREFGARGLTVVGVPCNQFADQEPGTAGDIAEFCQVNYGVSFPLAEKVEVNGAGRHPLYAELVDTPDGDGHTGDVRWNFEKFVVGPDGAVTARFGPQVDPQAAELVAAVTKVLPR